MYVFDPDKGRRRRALGRDKMRSYVSRARNFATSAARDANFRLKGVRARVRYRLARTDAPDDLLLIERARAAMGRVVSHAHAVQIGAKGGLLVVSGPILASEVPALLSALRVIPGVSEIEDHLIAHASPGSVPALQDGGGSSKPTERWTPAVRAAAIVGGCALTASGVRGRSLGGILLAAIGLALAARGATNSPVERLVAPRVPSRRQQPFHPSVH